MSVQMVGERTHFLPLDPNNLDPTLLGHALPSIV